MIVKKFLSRYTWFIRWLKITADNFKCIVPKITKSISSGVHTMKMNQIRLFLLFILGTTLLIAVPVPVAHPDATVYVDPPMSFAKPGESFNITLSVIDAVNVFAWQANLTYNPDVLEFQDAVEGDFLKDQPEGTSGLIKGEFASYVVLIVSTRGEYGGVSGRGPLATAEFKAKEGVTGETVLNISDPGVWNETLGYHQGGTQLIDPNEREIPRITEDGYFSNADFPPVASFTYSPSFPEVGETIYFDASASYDPDGDITQYEWDFGDGDIFNATDPTTTHEYADFGTYVVSLTVIDNATKPHIWYEIYSTKIEEIETKAAHSIAVLTVNISPPTVKVGDSVSVNVTVKNKGVWNETFTVNIYYDGYSAASEQTVTNLVPGTNKTLTFTWDTTGVAPGTYRINAIASAVEGELNTADNTKLSGTITVEEAGDLSFPLIYVAIVVVVVIIGVAAFFFLRRRTSPAA